MGDHVSPFPMTLLRIRRYPVKAMGGEWLDEVEVDARGLLGDRLLAVHDAEGRFATGKDSRRFRRLDGVFSYAATTGPSGVTVSRDEWTWDAFDPALDDDLTARLGAPVALRREGAVSHFDDRAVSVVGTATLEHLARESGADADPRRFRTNLVVQTTEPYVEDSWGRFAVGPVGRGPVGRGVVLEGAGPVPRCRVTTLAQDGVPAEPGMLRTLAPREVCLCAYADVREPGTLRVGDEVRLLD